MSIKSRVKKSIQDSSNGEFDNALIQAVIAIDATAKREGITGGNAERFKTFLINNRRLISKAGLVFLEFSGEVVFQGSINAEGKRKDRTFEEVLYHVLRCALLHEGEVPPQIIFTDKMTFGNGGGGQVIFPKTLIFGLLMSVIGSYANADEKIGSKIGVNIRGKKYLIDDMWGKKDEILKLFRDEPSAITPID